MSNEKTNMNEKFNLVSEHWKPGVIARINDYEMRIAKIKGEFEWHKHEDTDELFMVNKGSFNMEFRDKTVTLNQGDVLVVPKNTEHRPVAEQECEIIMFEPTGTPNTGSAGGERTVEVVDI